MRDKLNVRTMFHRPRGNVILLAIFILSGGIVGALTVALIVVSELRQARNLDNSLVAHYGAESGLEQSLYEVRKSSLCMGGTSCSDADYQNVNLPAGAAGACSGGAPGCTPQAYGRKISPPTVQQVASLKENDTFQLDLDPTIQQLRVLWLPADPGHLPYLEVSYVVGFNPPLAGGVTTQVCRPNIGALFAPYSCFLGPTHPTTCYYPSSATSPLLLNVASLAETDCTTGGTLQQVRFKALQADITPLTLEVAQPAGTGIGTYVEVKSRRTEGAATQNLQTVIPKQVPVYGFTDYVVFSEQDIVK